MQEQTQIEIRISKKANATKHLCRTYLLRTVVLSAHHAQIQIHHSKSAKDAISSGNPLIS